VVVEVALAVVVPDHLVQVVQVAVVKLVVVAPLKQLLLEQLILVVAVVVEVGLNHVIPVQVADPV
jgi:hypothetical protein